MSSAWRTATAGSEPAVHAYLGLGTNLGDREANLHDALRGLAGLGSIEAVSTVYASEPVGYRDQPDFWNLAIRMATTLAPPELLAGAKRIEAELGRRPSFRNAPRPIDIDILLYGDDVVASDALQIPHPRLLERAFVLRPLAELDPGLRHPVTGERLADRLHAPGLERTEPLFPGARLLRPADSDDDA
ncbi:MAG: 2-amino-4-hydroxy-6-hydroxymethyldihydropteridine diphosphokinase [Gemmatimonadetes bacterium]|nr:2-amino-4-hydroxy-6-hydroxymethyldihydropteridine diphosphokinase [Gemmatimonadota bacterium]